MRRTMRYCTVEGCEYVLRAKGLCNMHWQRQSKHGSLDLRPRRKSPDDRFWSKVRKTDTCWIWTGALFSTGYGAFNTGDRVISAHRYTYERLYGKAPSNMHLDHLCRVRECCNPDHLELVTPQVNFDRGEAPSALLKRENRCARGHDMTDSYVRRDTGGRMCRECAGIRRRKSPAEKKRLSVQDRHALYERCEGLCDWCGGAMPFKGMHAHHRLRRSQGGTWDLANILVTHPLCHVTDSKSIHQNPALATKRGALLRSGSLPEITPVEYPDGTVALLTSSGLRLVQVPILADRSAS